MDDFVVRSVTVSVVIAASVIRNCADLEVGIEDDE